MEVESSFTQVREISIASSDPWHIIKIDHLQFVILIATNEY